MLEKLGLWIRGLSLIFSLLFAILAFMAACGIFRVYQIDAVISDAGLIFFVLFAGMSWLFERTSRCFKKTHK